MYWPKCANPIDETQKFCRACGANVSLVPQALTGQLPVASADDEWDSSIQRGGRRRGRRRHKPPSIERAASSSISGIGFILAALFITFWFPGGFTWGWAFLFPAFALIGEGVGQYLKLKEMERQRRNAIYPPSPAQNHQPSFPSDPDRPEISAPTTSELQAPSSVAEHTTRHLDLSRQRQ